MTGASTETVALIAAGGTAAGALIGSTAGGVVSSVLERKREKRRAFARARLVRLDLSLMASALRDAEHDARWWQFRDIDPMPAWTEYAETLSVRISPAQFEDVTWTSRTSASADSCPTPSSRATWADGAK
jgi:hypothetical protein